MISSKTKKRFSIISLFLIITMILGMIAGALTGCGANEPENKSMLRIAALKGPTTIGIANLINESKNGDSDDNYEFTMYTSGSDIMAAFASGEMDIGLVPANIACIMNSKTEGGVSVIDINTLGVLYCITGDSSISSISDLSGRTVYTTGQGATPEYTIRHLLEQNNITDCNLEFKSEATEVAAFLTDDENSVAILPQPFVTVAITQNEKLHVAFSLDDEWSKTDSDSKIVTGVTVVRNNFLKEHKKDVDRFLDSHEKSVKKTADDLENTAKIVVDLGIIPKEPIAIKAIPNCNIVCIRGKEMQTILSGYINVLYQMDPKSIGGSIPDESFYYN